MDILIQQELALMQPEFRKNKNFSAKFITSGLSGSWKVRTQLRLKLYNSTNGK